VDDDLKTKPNDFWKYVSKIKKNEHVNQLKIGQKVITDPPRIFEAFADNFSPSLTLPLLSLWQTTLNLVHRIF
jgi:hypothetical protein